MRRDKYGWWHIRAFGATYCDPSFFRALWMALTGPQGVQR